MGRSYVARWAGRNKDRPERAERVFGGWQPVEPPHRKAHPVIHALAEAQNRLKVSTPVLAKKAGVDPDTIRQWRRGATNASVSGLEACLNVLGMTLDVKRLEDNG